MEQFSSYDGQEYLEEPKSRRSLLKLLSWFAILVVALILVTGILQLFRPPKNFPAPYFLRITQGETLFAITLRAERVHLVRSARVLQLATIMQGGERSIQAGDYYFDAPVTVMELARRLSTGDFNITPTRVTLPEGYTVQDMGETLERMLPNVTKEEFIALAKNDEGKLFPDTYFFSPAVTAEDVYQKLRQNFESKMKPFREEIAVSGRTEQQIVTMASLIEREANGSDDRAIIAGILWKRLDRGMLLQVDAPFYYLLGKTSAELTSADLKLASPYNTYVHTGLPPTPIGAPGVASIEAALNPEVSPYLFYLHDKNGVAHYAKNFSEHQANIRKYLR